VANAALLQEIEAVHQFSRGTYGAPRVFEEFKAGGRKISRNRIARLMQVAGIKGVSRRKACWTTIRDKDAKAAPDLVSRHFQASGPDQLWVADITYVPTWAGFLYLAIVLDVWSRKVVGWAMANHLRTELILDALNMALGRRGPVSVIHHSDQGCQYTSVAFGKRCEEAGVKPSMGSVGDAYDNAMAESFFATLECELLDRTLRATISVHHDLQDPGFPNPKWHPPAGRKPKISTVHGIGGTPTVSEWPSTFIAVDSTSVQSHYARSDDFTHTIPGRPVFCKGS
jgi:putative transposase